MITKFTKKLQTFFPVPTRGISSKNRVIADMVPPILPDEMKEIIDQLSPEIRRFRETYTTNVSVVLKSGRALHIKLILYNGLTDEEFTKQATRISRLNHENVVRLLGFSSCGTWSVLVYDCAPNGNLYDILHGRKGAKNGKKGPVLSWSQRVKVAIGAAKGLEYLFENANSSDLKYGSRSSNILLNEDYDVAKITIADSWISPSLDISDKISAIRDHMASGYCPSGFRLNGDIVDFGIPIGEFKSPSWFSDLVDDDELKISDTFSFGVVLLELLTGHKPIGLVEWATPKLNRRKVQQCIDPRLKGEYPRTEAEEMADIAYSCLKPETRPSISSLVRRLQILAEASKNGQRLLVYATG